MAMTMKKLLPTTFNAFNEYDLTDCDDACSINVESTDERNFDVRDATVQTAVHNTYNQDTGIYTDTSHRTDMKCQTQHTQSYVAYSNDVNDVNKTSIALQTNESVLQNIVSNTSISTEPLSQPCAAFVQRISSTMEHELQYNKESTVFDTYNFDSLNSDDTTVYSKLCTILSINTDTIQSDDLQRPVATAVSCMTHNAMCTSLCVAYGHTFEEHDGWCAHKSFICIYNMLRTDIYKHSENDTTVCKPDQTITVDTCCVTALLYHPTRHNILIVGLYTGDIHIYDIERPDDPLLCKSSDTEYTHREPINDIAVQYTAVNLIPYIVTCSNDGSILYWPIDSILNDMDKTTNVVNTPVPIEGQQLRPCSIYSSTGKLNNNKYHSLGCSTMSFNTLQQNTFIVGTPAGAVLQCYVNNNRRVDYKKNGYTKPKTSEYTWSNTALHLWLTCNDSSALKQKIETYAKEFKVSRIDLKTIIDSNCTTTELYKNPITLSYTAHHSRVNSIAYSPFNVNLFYTASNDSTVHLYHLLNKQPLLLIDISNKHTGKSVELKHIICSPVRPLVFAVCDVSNIYVFDLLQSSTDPILTIEHNTRTNKHSSEIKFITFNSKTGRTITVGDTLGYITVYELGIRLSTLQQNESQLCRKLGEMHTASTP